MSDIGPSHVEVYSDAERCEYEECGRPSVWTIRTDIGQLKKKRSACQQHLVKLVPAGQPCLLHPPSMAPIAVRMTQMDLLDQILKGLGESLTSVWWVMFGAVLVLWSHATRLRELVPAMLVLISARQVRVMWDWKRRKKS